MIPKIIHKIWFNFSGSVEGEHAPQKYIDMEKECIERQSRSDASDTPKETSNLSNSVTATQSHSNKKLINLQANALRPDTDPTKYVVMHWNEKDADEFIRTNYNFFYNHFINYPKKIQKVDALRYFILYHYGGIYLDMDIKCNKAFDFKPGKVYLVEDSNVANFIKFNNFIMVSPRRHPFWLKVFDTLIRNYKKPWYLTDFFYILYSTGPGMLMEAYNEYGDKSQIEILKKDEYNPCDACDKCSTKNSYIIHEGDAKWTTSIDSVLRAIYCHWLLLCIILITFVLLVVALVYRNKLKEILFGL